MFAGNLFSAASAGDAYEADPSIFQNLLNFKEQDQLPGYSSAFGDTSALFGGAPAAQGWSFNPMPQDQAPGGLDFSSVFQAAPKDFGSNFSGGFNPSAITFDPSSVNQMSLEDNLNDYIAQGGGKPKNLFAPVNRDAAGISVRQRGPGALRIQPPVESSKPKPQPAFSSRYKEQHDNDYNRRAIKWLMTEYGKLSGRKPMTLNQAAGLWGNIRQEVGPIRRDLHVSEVNGPGIGLLQYTGARKGPYLSAVEKARQNKEDYASPEWQLQYMERESMNKDLSGWSKWYDNIPDDPTKAAIHFQNRLLRPGDPHEKQRIGFSVNFSGYGNELMNSGYLPRPQVPTFASVGPR